ncbi:MAG: XdhC family protein [Cellulosilyticaceae bacterium]
MNTLEARQLAETLYRHKPHLVICGGGHVGYYMVTLGHMLDFEVTLIEDRESFANHERFPNTQIICKPFTEGLKAIEKPDRCYFVIVSRGHAEDMACLETILQQGFKYVGMMGSKAKIALVMKSLEAKGFEKEILECVHTPIGLAIGAVTPAEIGVSIAAELIKAKSQQEEMPYVGTEVIEALRRDEAAVLATIVAKSGSAPNGIGATIVLKRDGTAVGTIGGGRIEHIVLERAREVSSTEVIETQTYNVAPKGDDPIGMICGGAVTIRMETILEKE